MLDYMVATMNMGEFETMLFTTFKMSSDNLRGSEKPSKMREMVAMCERKGWQKILAEALGWKPEAIQAPRQGAQSFNGLLLYAIRLDVDSMKFTRSKGAGANFLTTGGNIGSQNEFGTLMVISGILTTDSMVKVGTLWIAPGARVQFDSQCEIGKVMMIPGAVAPQGGWRTNIPQQTWVNESDFVNQAKSLGLIP